ncbi:hypothetical protein BU15DRAFT_67816 [Melanogaster broomeanus]|nr:hypothetical protein BU15DRAFT_67816 [Melanogaster broomeanus]
MPPSSTARTRGGGNGEFEGDREGLTVAIPSLAPPAWRTGHFFCHLLFPVFPPSPFVTQRSALMVTIDVTRWAWHRTPRALASLADVMVRKEAADACHKRVPCASFVSHSSTPLPTGANCGETDKVSSVDPLEPLLTRSSSPAFHYVPSTRPQTGTSMPQRVIMHGPMPTTAPASKRQRTEHGVVALHVTAVTSPAAGGSDGAPLACSGTNTVQPPPHLVQYSAVTCSSQTAAFDSHNPALTVLPSDPMQLALHNLDMEAHAVRARVIADERDDKETKRSYARHVRNYVVWWENEQSRLASECPTRPRIPALPITPAKVVLFLDYETTREKLRQSMPWRTNAGMTSTCTSTSPDTQRRLRDDTRVRAIESASKHNEPKRIDTAQTLKAAGTSQDTYTKEQLERCSLWGLSEGSGPQTTWVALRDRAMLLVSCATAFRGGSCRALEWSDLFLSRVFINGSNIAADAPVLAALADNAKHNQVGRVEENGALRHRDVKVCAVGAIAMLFFAHFHIINQPVPSFEPDFETQDFGEYGFREWYSYHVFWTKSVSEQMSYENHRDRVKHIHVNNNISTTKVTHAPRHYAAQTARNHGQVSLAPKHLGAGLRMVPSPQSMTTPSCGCHAWSGEIFPWVENQQNALTHRERCNPRARDISLTQFLNLTHLAAHYHSRLPIFQYPPFNSAAFHAFASASVATLARAADDAEMTLKNLPDNLVTSMNGFLSRSSLQKREI